MKTFVLTSKFDAHFETFKSLEELLEKLDQYNEKFYDGDSYSMFGGTLDGSPYIVDSVVLTRGRGGDQYFTYLIHAIDLRTGEVTTLD